MDPVADLHAVPIDRHLLVTHQVRDEKRDYLFGELVRAVVVRAACDNRIHAESVGVGQDEHIGTGLDGGVKTGRGERRGLRHMIGRGERTGAILRDVMWAWTLTCIT